MMTLPFPLPWRALAASVLAWTTVTVCAAGQEWHFEFSGGVPDKLVWQTEAGTTYDLWFTDDLSVPFAHVGGFPQAGSGDPMEHPFTPGVRGFFKITTETSALGGFVWIPGGSFEMGDKVGSVVGGDGWSHELPVHTVSLSGFFMQSTEVTNDQMAAVLQWAYDAGGKITVTTSSVRNVESDQELLDLDDGDCRITWNAGTEQFELKAAKDSGYPCVEVTWYGSAAWCNYRSAMKGLTPCYNLSNWSCNFGAKGYRLPTEAEWEYAARGGLSNKRFPWGDTISHDQANFSNSGGEPYQYGTTGPHPDWEDGGYAHTSVVGSFPATGEGLYDMAGNVWEWCNDWYGSYPSGPQTDPAGPAAGSDRVLRGGSLFDDANYCRVAGRIGDHPPGSGSNHGFRPVRSSVP